MTQLDPAETYRQEAAELLDQLEHALLDLEHAPADADLVNTAFRALHTIKGSGAMFGFDRVAGFTHHVETAFDLVRKGKAIATPGLIAVSLAAGDHIRRLIETPHAVAEEAGEAILEQLRATVALPADAEVPAPVAASPTPTAWRLRFRLPTDAMAMGTNPLRLLDELRALGPCSVRPDASRIPPLEELDPTECHVGWEVMLSTDQSRDAIEQVFLFVVDGMELDLAAV
jgi:two-component system chemotaxis sensor kinase CheA